MSEWYDIPSEEMTLEQVRSAVKELRKKVAEQYMWIDVNKQHPQQYQEVLAYILTPEGKKFYQVLQYSRKDGSDEWYLGFIRLYKSKVTHWIPCDKILPPNEQNNE